MQLQEDLAERIVATGCHGVIIDITALDIVDSFVGRMLSTIAVDLQGAGRRDGGRRACARPSPSPWSSWGCR